MKELSIEEKARRYDRAIERANSLLSDNQLGNAWIYKLLPELKESEDERIKNEIIAFIEQSIHRGGGTPIPQEQENKWIAWLEAQGDSIKIKKGKNYLCTKTHKYAGLEWIEGIKYYSPEDYSLVNQGCTCYCPKYSKKEHNNFFKEVELKRVEPKFKVGDWIITSKKHIWCVDETPETTSYLYRLVNQYGKVEVAEFEVVDEKARLWTIQDAKDGDVLYCESNGIEYIVMSKGINKYGHIDSYFRYNSLNGFGVDIPSVFSTEQDNITPATKEQRDQLEKAMADAGYTFDFEKKELKKIESDLTEFENVLADVCRGWIGEELGWKDYIIKNSLPLLELAKKQFDEYEQKPKQEWNEEDEAKMKSILFHIEDVENKDVINWFKSLKNRVQPQSMQEWSKEDKTYLDHIITAIKSYYTDDKGKENPWREELLRWLESLKERYTWKPSDRQMQQLGWIAEQNEHNLIGKELMTLYKDLKKLRKE